MSNMRYGETFLFSRLPSRGQLGSNLNDKYLIAFYEKYPVIIF